MKRIAGAASLAVLKRSRPHAHEHLDELAARYGEEGDARLAGHGPGEQRLAGARRAHQEHALWHTAAEPLKLLRILEELDDLLEVGLHLLQAGDVGERHLFVAGPVAFGGRLRKAAKEAGVAEGIAGTLERHPEACHQQERHEHVEAEQEARAVARLPDSGADGVVEEQLVEPLAEVGGEFGAKGLAAWGAGCMVRGRGGAKLADERVAHDLDAGDVAGLHLADEFVVADGGRCGGLLAGEHGRQGEGAQDKHDDHRHVELRAEHGKRIRGALVRGAFWGRGGIHRG